MSTDTDSDDTTAEPTVESHAPTVEDIDLEPGEYVYQTQRHRNGDETAVLLTAFCDGWQAMAVDVGPAEGILEIEIIGHADERARAVGMCEYWLQQHPDGVLGGAPEGDDSLTGRIMAMFGGAQ